MEERLRTLNIININTLKQITTDESEENNSDSEIDINTLAQLFTNDQNMDQLTNVQTKERALQHDPSAYDRTSVYE